MTGKGGSAFQKTAFHVPLNVTLLVDVSILWKWKPLIIQTVQFNRVLQTHLWNLQFHTEHNVIIQLIYTCGISC